MKNICWQITLADTSWTKHPPPFHLEKNLTKLKEYLIFNVIRVLGYSTIGVHLFQKEKKVTFKKFLHLHSGKS